MKRTILTTVLVLLAVLAGFAQTDALVVELRNGLADIYPVTENLHIVNQTDKESILVVEGTKHLASYSSADVKRIAFDEEALLTDSVERAALVAIYKATDGTNWTNNTNWCSDKPLSEWIGISYRPGPVGHVKGLLLGTNELTGTLPIELGNLKHLVTLYLAGNKFTGGLPSSIGNLTQLNDLYCYLSNLSGPIPKEIGNMTNLRTIDLLGNNLTGEIPSEIGNLVNLETLRLNGNRLTGTLPSEMGNLIRLEELNLVNNQLTGEIPESFSNLTGLIRKGKNNEVTGRDGYCFALRTWDNNLSGKIPSLFQNSPYWKDEWITIMYGNHAYDLNEVYIPAPSFRVKDIDGNILDSEEIYSKNKYTAIFHWATWCGFSNELMPVMIQLYEKYKDYGFEVIGLTYDETDEEIRKYVLNNAIQWKNFISTSENCFDYCTSFATFSGGYPDASTPELSLVDNNGRVVFTDRINERFSVSDFLRNKLGEGNTNNTYKSTDYSADGKVKRLQTATGGGKDIKVVLMGDGFSDRMIADGRYDAAMQKAKEALFASEPIKSYRDKFTVYSVTAVSENEIFDKSAHTAFSGNLGMGTEISGNDAKVFEYAQKAIAEKDMDDAIIIVIMNSPKWAGTCYMYHPETNNTWGSGAMIAYIPNFEGNGGMFDYYSFETILTHEAIGHGFAKLGDEYVTEEESIPTYAVMEYKAQTALGWWKNIDFTNDPKAVKWGTFFTTATSEVPVYSWVSGYDDYEGSYEFGGKAIATDGESVNFQWRGWCSIRLNKKKAEIETDYVEILLDQPLKAGDKLYITAYRYKDNDANANLYIRFENGYIIDEGSAVTWNNVYGGNNMPNTNVYDVGKAAGSKSFKMVRSKSGTNIFILEIKILRSATSGPVGDYSSERIGVYEGALTYRSGVWRPTEKSIMSSDDTEFNAPSREAIWYRINKLTQGESWEGTREDFVAFDKARATARASARAKANNKDLPKPVRLASPVVKKITWRMEK